MGRRITRFQLLLLVVAVGLSSCSQKDDDDSSPAAAADPCGVIYEPLSPLAEGDPVVALVTAEGLGVDPLPLRVRTGLYDDAASSFAVLWETDVDTSASVVQWGVDSVEENTKVVSTFTLGDDTRIHEGRICELQPGTTYQYRVGAEGAFSETFTYTTFDPGATELSFLALGDSRDGEEMLGQLLDMGMSHAPQFVLHTGDFVFLAHDMEQWGVFLDAISPEISRMPLVPVHGNHEFFMLQYFGMVTAPGNEEWYSLDLGPLHLAVINDSRGTEGIAAQTQWLDQDLASSDATFKIVSTHRGVYSSSNHGSTASLQEYLVPVADARGVDLVITGHDHGYERSFPMKGGEVVDPDEGTIYLTTAGAGAGLYGFAGDFFTAHAESVHHYTHIRIAGGRLTATAIRHDGTVLDVFEIDKSP